MRQSVIYISYIYYYTNWILTNKRGNNENTIYSLWFKDKST
jgi:hypothetical protein